jgi:hypothetical protein
VAKTRIVEGDMEEEIREKAEELAQLNEDEGGEIFRAIEEMRGAQGTQVVIIKLSPQDEAGVCDSIPVAEFSIDELKRRYGTGSYKIRVRGPKGWIPGGGNVRISTAGAKPASASAAPANDMTAMFELMDRRASEARGRMNDWIKLIITTMAPIVAAWIARPSQDNVASLVTALKPAPGPTLAELSQMMVNMQTLGNPKDSGSTVDTVLRVFEAAQGMMDGKPTGEKGEGSSWVDIVRDLIKAAPEALKPMLAARMAAMQPGARSTVSQVQPQISTVPTAATGDTPSGPASTQHTASVSPAASTSSPSDGMNLLSLMMPAIKLNLGKCVGWAEKDRDPETYAGVLVDELPDNFAQFVPYDQCMTYLNHPEWFEKICEIEPRLANFRPWCDETRLAIIAIFNEFPEGEEAPPTIVEPNAGDTSHASES